MTLLQLMLMILFFKITSKIQNHLKIINFILNFMRINPAFKFSIRRLYFVYFDFRKNNKNYHQYQLQSSSFFFEFYNLIFILIIETFQ